MKKNLVLALTIGTSALISGCGGSSSNTDSSSSSSSSSNNSTQTGTFVDSAVAGIEYKTQTQSGMTNDKGEYQYMEGEQVTFKVGDIALPAVTAEKTVTPLTIFSAVDTFDKRVVNLSRLLQTLDTDGNPENGITINYEAAKSASTGAKIDFSAENFDAQAAVVNIASNGGGMKTALVDAAAAVQHLQTSIDQAEVIPTFNAAYLAAGSPWYNIEFDQENDDSQKVIASCGGKATFSENGQINFEFIEETNILDAEGNVTGKKRELKTNALTYEIVANEKTIKFKSASSSTSTDDSSPIAKVRSDYFILPRGPSSNKPAEARNVFFKSRSDAIAFAKNNNADLDCNVGLPE